MKTDILILGADGQQGIIATRFLSQRGHSIVVADIYRDNVQKEIDHAGGKIPFQFCDHRHTYMLRDILERFQPRIVLNCASDFYNDGVLQACIDFNTHYVDLGSDIPGTARRLIRHQEVKAAGLTAIMGCGSVPGIGSVMMKHMAGQMHSVESAEAGFAWDSNMKDFVPPFFLYVVTLELSLPALVMENNELVTVPPLSESKCREFELLGEQVVYLVPHSEVYSFHHYFKDKGLKNVKFFAGFPAHSKAVIDSLIKMGFQHDQPVIVVTDAGPTKVQPCDFLTAMSKRIPTPAGYKESENLWVTVRGEVNKLPVVGHMECIVPPLPGWEEYGCNVDTAFPACIITEMLLENFITDRGVYCPEGIIPEMEFFNRLNALGFTFKGDIKPAL